MDTTSCGEPMAIDFKAECASDLMTTLLFNEDYADIIFIVDDERVPVHSNILAASSEYFRAMFYGYFREANKKEICIDENVVNFKFLIQYIYQGFSDLEPYNIMFLMEIYTLADKYIYPLLKASIEDHVMNRINMTTMHVLLNCIQQCQTEQLYNSLLKHIDLIPLRVVRSYGFKLFSKEVVSDIIKRNSFEVDEFDIFKAVVLWSKANTKNDLNFILPNVRLTLMQISELEGYVASTGLLERSKIESAINEIRSLQKLPFRDGKIHRNQIVYISQATNNNDIVWENMERVSLNQICIKLPAEVAINYIEIDMISWGNYKYNVPYYIEISRDSVEWQRIIDYKKYRCCFIQQLFFQMTPVLYIYIRFMKNTICSSVKARVCQEPPHLVNGIMAPSTTKAYPFIKLLRRLDESGRGYIKIALGQPLHINCVYVRDSRKKIIVKGLKTSISNISYKEIDIKRGKMRNGVLFKGHTVLFMKIEFTPKLVLDIFDIAFFFNDKIC